MPLPPAPGTKGDVGNMPPQQEEVPELTQSERDFATYNKALSDYAKILRGKNISLLQQTKKADLSLIQILEENKILTTLEEHHIELESIHRSILACLKAEPLENEDGIISKESIDSFVEKMRLRCTQIEQKGGEVTAGNTPDKMQKLAEELRIDREKKEKGVLKNELISAIGDESTTPEDKYEHLSLWRNKYLKYEKTDDPFRISVKKNMAFYIELYTRAFFFLRKYKNTTEHKDLVALLSEQKLSELELGMRHLARILSGELESASISTLGIYQKDIDALRERVDMAMKEPIGLTHFFEEIEGKKRLAIENARGFANMLSVDALKKTDAVTLLTDLKQWKEDNLTQLEPEDEKLQRAKVLLVAYIDYFIALCEHDKDAIAKCLLKKGSVGTDLSRMKDWAYFQTARKNNSVFIALMKVPDETIDAGISRLEKQTEEMTGNKHEVDNVNGNTAQEKGAHYIEARASGELIAIMERNDHVEMSANLASWKETYFNTLEQTDERLVASKELLGAYIDFFIAFFESNKVKQLEARFQKGGISTQVLAKRMRGQLALQTEGNEAEKNAFLSSFDAPEIALVTKNLEESATTMRKRNAEMKKKEPVVADIPNIREEGIIYTENNLGTAARDEFLAITEDTADTPDITARRFSDWKTKYEESMEHHDARLTLSKDILFAYIDFFIALSKSKDIDTLKKMLSREGVKLDIFMEDMKRHIRIQNGEEKKIRDGFLNTFTNENAQQLLSFVNGWKNEIEKYESKDTGKIEAKAPAIATAEVIIEKNLEEKAVGELEAIMIRQDYIEMGTDLALWKNTYAPSIKHSDPLLIESQKMLFAYVDFFITLYQSGDISNVERLKVLLRNSGVKLTVFTKDMIRHATIQTEENEEMRKTFLSSAKTNIIEEQLSFIQGWKQEIITFIERNEKEGGKVEDGKKDPIAKTTPDDKKAIDNAEKSPPTPSPEKKNRCLAELAVILDGLENKADIRKEVKDLQDWFRKNIYSVEAFSSLLDETLRARAKEEEKQQKGVVGDRVGKEYFEKTKARIIASRRLLRDMVNIIATISSHEKEYKAHWDTQKERKLQEKRKGDLAFAVQALKRESDYLMKGIDTRSILVTSRESPVFPHEARYKGDSAWAHDEMYRLENPFKRPQSLRTLDSCFEGAIAKEEKLAEWKKKYLIDGDLQKERQSHATYRDEVYRDYGVETEEIAAPVLARVQVAAELLIDFITLPEEKRNKFVIAGQGANYNEHRLKQEFFAYIRILTGKQHKIHSNIYTDLLHEKTIPNLDKRITEISDMLRKAQDDTITSKDIEREVREEMERKIVAPNTAIIPTPKMDNEGFSPNRGELDFDWDAWDRPSDKPIIDPDDTPRFTDFSVDITPDSPPQPEPENPLLPKPKKPWLLAARNALRRAIAASAIAGGEGYGPYTPFPGALSTEAEIPHAEIKTENPTPAEPTPPADPVQPTPEPVNPTLPKPKRPWIRSARKVLLPILAGSVLAGGGFAAYKLLKDTQKDTAPEIPNLEKEGINNYMATPKFMEFFREINALGKANNNAYYEGVEHYLNANTVGINTIIHYMTAHKISVADIIRTQGEVAIYTAKYGTDSYDKHQNVSKELYALLVETTKLYQANQNGGTLTYPHVIPRSELYALALNQHNIIEYIKAVNERSKVITLNKTKK